MKAPVEELILRGDDPTGHGYYGAKRGNRKHKGVDLVTKAGESIKAPISGVITKIGYPYANALQFRYVDIQSDIYRFRIMYCQPIDGIYVGIRVFEGQEIAKAQDIAGYWNPKMLNHIHIELYKHGLLTDPEPLLLPKPL